MRLLDRLSTPWHVLAKEISAFGVVGVVNLFVDIGLFNLLHFRLGLGPTTSNVLSAAVATTISYFANRHWSFSHRARTGLRREYLLFAIVNGVTLLIGLAIVWFVHGPLGQDSALVLQAANIASIALGTAIRYVSYRRWVFPAHAPGPDGEHAAQQAREAALRQTA
jgi:putative flippase GtrA